MSLLRAVGAVILGKTDTVEFAATGRRAATRNPLDLTRTRGGSSSGSAAAVADRHVPLAVTTQTGGSTIRPASFCRIWALKPTWGLISTGGCKRYAPTLGTLGWMARSAADLRPLLDVFDAEGAPASDPPFELEGARIAICRTPMWLRAEPATQAAMEHAQDLLARAGAQLHPLDLPSPFESLPALQMRVMRAEGQVSLLNEYRLHGDALEPSLRDQVLLTGARFSDRRVIAVAQTLGRLLAAAGPH